MKLRIDRGKTLSVIASVILSVLFISCQQTVDSQSSISSNSEAASFTISMSSSSQPDNASSVNQVSSHKTQSQNSSSKATSRPTAESSRSVSSNIKTESEPIMMQPVTIYTDTYFSGVSASLTPGTYRFDDISVFHNKQIGSVEIPKGMSIRFYRKNTYGGGFISFEENEYDLTNSGWSQNIDSIDIRAAVPETNQAVLGYNYILGTQIFGPLYHFSDNDAIYEAAQRIYQMGSNTIKMSDTSDYDAILRDMDFRYVYLWMRSDDTNWRDGLSDIEEEIEYEYIYEAVKKLLIKYNNSGKSFYLGHWEGDWYLIDNYNASQTTISQTRLQGMIDWLNIRQKAIDDAKRDVSHRNVYIWGYTEANRTADVFTANADRLANRVLPYVNIDYLSYSAYDIQGMSASKVESYLQYMESQMRPKSGVPGKRVFVGETALPSVITQSNQNKHNADNIKLFIKYFDAGVNQILYWQMYNNEQNNGVQQGYWLIDNNNVKWKLYYSFKAFYDNAREYVRTYHKQYDRAPDLDTFCNWASIFLKTLQ